jgi:hypothetical protein
LNKRTSQTLINTGVSIADADIMVVEIKKDDLGFGYRSKSAPNSCCPSIKHPKWDRNE